MYITTQKTNDRLPINLNKYAKEILAKYEKRDFPDNLALPVITSYPKTLCNLAGIRTPVTVVCIKGGERVEHTAPQVSIHWYPRRPSYLYLLCSLKWHSSPGGDEMKWTSHSDYKAMKPYIDIAEKPNAERHEALRAANGEIISR